MSYIKIAAATLAATSFATATLAGSANDAPADDVVTEVVEEAEGSSAASSNGGILLPLLGLALVAALVASGDDS